jgi:hypothetical protein
VIDEDYCQKQHQQHQTTIIPTAKNKNNKIIIEEMDKPSNDGS